MIIIRFCRHLFLCCLSTGENSSHFFFGVVVVRALISNSLFLGGVFSAWERKHSAHAGAAAMCFFFYRGTHKATTVLQCTRSSTLHHPRPRRKKKRKKVFTFPQSLSIYHWLCTSCRSLTFNHPHDVHFFFHPGEKKNKKRVRNVNYSKWQLLRIYGRATVNFKNVFLNFCARGGVRRDFPSAPQLIIYYTCRPLNYSYDVIRMAEEIES